MSWWLLLRWSGRDLRRKWVQVAAIALVIAIGTGLFSALGSTLKTPAARKIIEAGGGQLAASASPQAYAEFIRAEGAKWIEIVRLIGLTPN